MLPIYDLEKEKAIARQVFTTMINDDDYERKCAYCVYKCPPTSVWNHCNKVCSEYILDFEKYLQCKGVELDV